MTPLITITSDFGESDGYVAAMKGTILTINPAVRIVDISHQIASFDIMDAAFILRQAVGYFPAGTVHLVVVDPGVGTGRRAVALSHNGQIFVGPDNGLFALLLGDEKPSDIVQLDRVETFRCDPPADTFHGRDIFAPAAAHLASGRTLEEVGTPIEALRPLHWALPIDDNQGIRGWIVHIDHFGNCVTNIPRELFHRRRSGRNMKCYVGNAILSKLHTVYGDVAAGDPLLLFGSDDFLEIAVNTGHAADLLQIRRGTPVNVVFLEDR